jgi:hypothetical protein
MIAIAMLFACFVAVSYAWGAFLRIMPRDPRRASLCARCGRQVRRPRHGFLYFQ